jgi:hypothetical protein
MKRIFPYAVVKELIQKGGFGTYRLFVLPDNNLVAGSHLQADQDSDVKMSPDNLIIDLQDNVDLMGNGLYRITLKKTNKSQANTEVNYIFQVNEEGAAVVTQSSMAGVPLSQDRIEEIVNQRLTALLAAKTAEMEKQRIIDNLTREVDLLKKKKPVRKKSNDLGALLNIGLVAGSAFITEQWPNSKSIVEKALDSIKALEEDEEEEEETGFTPPQ